MARRLRIPAVLAVSMLGTSASLAVTFGGCETGVPDPIDGKAADMLREDARPDDSGTDVGVDRDARPDAPEPRPDARPR